MLTLLVKGRGAALGLYGRRFLAKVKPVVPQVPIEEGKPVRAEERVLLGDLQRGTRIRETQRDNLQDGEEISPSHATESVTEVMWQPIGTLTDKSQMLSVCAGLSKARLTGLVVMTALAGYAVAPGPFSILTLGACLTGTALTSTAANTINQILEIPYDSQMNRTKNRPLVRGRIPPPQAALFALSTSIAGISLLYTCVNPLTAGLGAFNLLLYTSVYTPLKRVSIFNTWLGSLVGAIPPLMGWTAATGAMDPGAFLLGSLLFAWQFPHFMALSWNLRGDYSRAGYRMTSVLEPAMCRRVSLRYSLLLIPICTAAPLVDLTSWFFAVEALPINLYLVYLATRFYYHGDSSSSRKLFRYTLIHLPVLLFLLILDKKRPDIDL